MPSKTLGLTAALGIARKSTTLPVTADLAPVAPVVSTISAPPQRRYKDRPANQKPTFVSLDLNVKDALDELKFRSKRSLNDLADEAFRDLLEKYRFPVKETGAKEQEQTPLRPR